MRKLFLTLCLFGAMKGAAQMPALPPEVRVQVADSLCVIERVSTQTEVSSGIKFGNIKLGGRRALRYLWGKQSRQYVDNPMPSFVIDPQGCQLSDFVLIRLFAKKVYRIFPEPSLLDNDYIPIDLNHFTISLRDDDTFLVRPLQRLKPGEYMLVNAKQQPHGDLGDYFGYCFTILPFS